MDRFAQLAMYVSGVVLATGTFVVLITMMSSVNERTREIGIFRAIGFRKSHIVGIILMEAGIVSVIGGLAGYVLGMIAAKLAAPTIARMEINIAWNYQIGLAALGVAIVIGLAASSIPAFKAAKQDPVEALRFI